MKKIFLSLALTIVQVSMLNAQTNKTFFLGHSLINFHTPNMVNKLSIAAGKTYSYDANIGIGSNLMNHWNNPNSGQGSDWITTLPIGGFENFIITEAVPLLPHLQWSNTYRFADSLYQFAMQQNPDIQYYIYETWHCTTTGTPEGCEWDNDDALAWRPRLTADLVHWESIADSMNLIHDKEMLIIPAGQAMGRLHDSIMANSIPGITSMDQLFGDDIHLTYSGIYFIACLMYGVIHKESPVGLPNQLTTEWDVLYDDYPTPAQALMMQNIAWSTLCDYPRDGVNCLPLSVYEIDNASTVFTVYPNPSKDKIIITGQDTFSKVEIVNILGETVYAEENLDTTTHELNLTGLKSGVYFVKVSNESGSHSKKVLVE